MGSHQKQEISEKDRLPNLKIDYFAMVLNQYHQGPTSDSSAYKWYLHKCASISGSRGPLNKHRHTF